MITIDVVGTIITHCDTSMIVHTFLALLTVEKFGVPIKFFSKYKFSAQDSFCLNMLKADT